MDWKEFVYGYKNGHTWQETADEAKRRYPTEFGVYAYNKVRQYLRRRYKSERTNSISHLPLPSESLMYSISNEYKADGTFVSDKLITICEDTPITPESIMKAHGLQPGLWQVVSYKNNLWHSQNKSNERMVMYQSKLVAKPTVNGLDLDQIADYIKTLDFNSMKPKTKFIQYDATGEVLEICLPDIHSGLLAWRKETGADYDLKIAEEYFWRGFDDVLVRCKNRKFKKIYFSTLGDLLHVDNDENKTTKGTLQNADGRITKIFIDTLDMLIRAITILGDIAPVEVVYCCGNHDRIMGYALMVALEKAFRFDDNIVFDTEPNPQKYRLIGVNLIGWTHGDMPPKNMSSWLVNRARKEYGQSKYAEVHAGHWHTEKVGEYKQTESDRNGIIVRHLPSLCTASYYENKEGYPLSEKTLMSYVWNENTGLRDIWYSNI